jgi:hypothetical protein
MPADQTELEAVEAELTRLETLRLDGLRSYWRARWGAPPELRSVLFLRHMIAWRIQAEAYGGLDAQTKALLWGKSIPRPPGPPAGAQIIREYQGVMHRVQVGEGAYRYNGRDYRNLTAIAKAITGTHWNGPAFFGLREKGPR